MISSPLATFAQPLDPSAEKRLAEVQEQLRKLERRDWWLWSMAVIVMLLLTFAVFSMSFPSLTKVDDPFFQFSLNQSVRGLIGLVLLFNTYTIYQQVAVKRLRRQFSKQLDDMRVLQVRAEEFHRLAIVDPLTGLYNRRVAEERLAAEASRSRRYGHSLAVISFDLDKFKEINDTYGHLAGDQVLKEFALRLSLQSVCRTSPRAWAVMSFACYSPNVQRTKSRLSWRGCGTWRPIAAGRRYLSASPPDGLDMNWEKPRNNSSSARTVPFIRTSARGKQESRSLYP